MNERKTPKILLVIVIIISAYSIYASYKAIMYRAYINYWLDKYNAVVIEFSGRDTYANENKSLKSDIQVPDRIVFIGTQVTKRWKLNEYFNKYEVINRGVEGQRFSGFLLRFVPDVIELNPSVVVVEISSYNFRPQWTVKEIQDYVTEMTNLACSNKIVPILSTVIPLRKDYGDLAPYCISDTLSVFNSWLKGYCLKTGVPCVDFHSLLADNQGYLREDLSFDSIDPNDKGYQIMSDALLRVLDSLH